PGRRSGRCRRHPHVLQRQFFQPPTSPPLWADYTIVIRRAPPPAALMLGTERLYGGRMPSRFRLSPRWPLARGLALVVAVLLVIASLIGAGTVVSALELRPNPNHYNLAAWEARNLPAKWLYELGELFRSSRSLEQQNADIVRFLELTREINLLQQRDAADTADQLADLHR